MKTNVKNACTNFDLSSKWNGKLVFWHELDFAGLDSKDYKLWEDSKLLQY